MHVWWHLAEMILFPLWLQFDNEMINLLFNDWETWKKSPAHFDDFVQALVGDHADVWFAVIAAEQKHLHGDAEQLLKLRRRSAPRTIENKSQTNVIMHIRNPGIKLTQSACRSHKHCIIHIKTLKSLVSSSQAEFLPCFASDTHT